MCTLRFSIYSEKESGLKIWVNSKPANMKYIGMEPDFFLHLGDTIYADRGGTATRLPDFWAKYRANRLDPASQRLFAETGAYVISRGRSAPAA